MHASDPAMPGSCMRATWQSRAASAPAGAAFYQNSPLHELFIGRLRSKVAPEQRNWVASVHAAPGAALRLWEQPSFPCVFPSDARLSADLARVAKSRAISFARLYFPLFVAQNSLSSGPSEALRRAESNSRMVAPDVAPSLGNVTQFLR